MLWGPEDSRVESGLCRATAAEEERVHSGQITVRVYDWKGEEAAEHDPGILSSVSTVALVRRDDI